MVRSEVCKNCCPNGGALFTEEFGTFQHVSTKEWMEEDAWVKVCNNCGHYKLKRKSKRRLTFDEILAMKDDSALKTMRDRALFHVHADAGARNQYEEICKAYTEKCKEHDIDKYPVIMHWYLNTYHSDKLYDLMKKKRIRKWDVDYHIGALKKDLEKAQTILAQDFPETKGGH